MLLPKIMTFITHVGTAVPQHAIEQGAVAGVIAKSLRLGAERSAAVDELFSNTHVRRRRSVLSLDRIGEPRTLTEGMALYRRHGLELAVTAAKDCLDQAALGGRDVDLVITSSCTGLLLPSLAVLLMKPLGLRDDVGRLPITELGCAGGAGALAQAHAHLRADPKARVLVVAMELPTLTFRTDDPSSANIVASSLFGDGAAAVLLRGGPGAGGLEILATHTGILPQSIDDMGFDLRDSGLYVVLSRNVPRLIAEGAPHVVERFLRKHSLSLKDLSFFVLHPGGRRVLEALEGSLVIDRTLTAASWDVLREYGNQSSASVLFVLGETLKREVPRGYGLLAAFGPGITVELALLGSSPC
jgi:alkylresorcinol/alkylpyrone synthase